MPGLSKTYVSLIGEVMEDGHIKERCKSFNAFCVLLVAPDQFVTNFTCTAPDA
jgi:hypothetical protein